MCAIAGLWRPQDGVDEQELAAMLALMQHRGPDDEGRFMEADLGLGMRRLAVRDVSGGRQPYRSEDGSIIAVFNGEIYNYRDLASLVQSHHHRLASATDGEVLVHLYEMEGLEAISRLQGMFAVAIWDRSRQQLLLARDHVGQKPLYLYESHQSIAFASELKALYALSEFTGELDAKFLSTYLGHRYVPAPDTMVKGVTKLRPGEAVLIERNRAPKKWLYWQPAMTMRTPVPSFEEATDELDQLLQQTVASHLDADVPLGLFLSGGLDSSLLAALAHRDPSRPLDAWVAQYPNHHAAYDETVWAEAVARQFDLKLHTVDVEWSLTPERLSALAYALDEPMADPTALPLDAIARAASTEETVMLSGEGADELFAGYSGYQEIHSLRALQRIPSPLRQWWQERGWPGSGAFARSLVPVSERYRGVGFTFHPAHQAALLRPEHQSCDRSGAVAEYWREASSMPDLQAMQGFDIRWFLGDDVLHKADRLGMLHSLEIRVPYCDYRIVEFALGLPVQYRRTAKQDKRILRSVALRHLPANVVWRRKRGFPTPLTDVLNGPLRSWAEDVLTNPDAAIRQWFVPSQVSRLLGQIAPGESTISRQVYALLLLELWAKTIPSRRRRVDPLRSATAVRLDQTPIGRHNRRHGKHQQRHPNGEGATPTTVD